MTTNPGVPAEPLMTAAPVAVLYVRTTVELADSVRQLAALAHLPMSDVVAAIISAATGVEHPHQWAVDRALTIAYGDRPRAHIPPF